MTGNSCETEGVCVIACTQQADNDTNWPLSLLVALLPTQRVKLGADELAEVGKY